MEKKTDNETKPFEALAKGLDPVTFALVKATGRVPVGKMMTQVEYDALVKTALEARIQ